MGDVLKFCPAGSTTHRSPGTYATSDHTKQAAERHDRPSFSSDLDEVQAGIKLLADLVKERGGTGLAVVITKAGRPDCEFVFGELARDVDLAYAAARRLVDRTGWPR